MPWPVYLAFKQLFPSGRRLPFFTLISILGVGLGVALMLVSTSVMGGFGYQIRTMIIDTQGEVQIRGRGPITVTPVLEQALQILADDLPADFLTGRIPASPVNTVNDAPAVGGQAQPGSGAPLKGLQTNPGGTGAQVPPGSNGGATSPPRAR